MIKRNDDIMLDTENGQVKARVMSIFEIENVKHIALVPYVQSNRKAPDMLLYSYTEEENVVNLSELTDEQFKVASAALEAILNSEFTA